MLVVGVDPGLSGAFSVIGPDGLRGVFDLPTMPVPGAGPDAKVKMKIDGRAFAFALRRACPAEDGKPTFVIEAVGPTGPSSNHSIQTQTSLIRSLGALETVPECMGWPIMYVLPQTWKRRFGLIDSNLKDYQRKAKSLEVARKLYPMCTDIGLAKFHNRAEALLLAHYGRMELA